MAVAVHVYLPPKCVGLFMEVTVSLILYVGGFTKASAKGSTDLKFGKPETDMPVLQ